MSTLLLALSLIGVPAKLTPLSSTVKEVWVQRSEEGSQVLGEKPPAAQLELGTEGGVAVIHRNWAKVVEAETSTSVWIKAAPAPK